MKRFKELLEKPWAAYSFALCSAVLVFLLLSNIKQIGSAITSVWDWISPILTGIIVAYLFNPISAFFQRTILKKIKKESTRNVIGVTLTIVCIVLFVAILLLALIPSLAQSISKLIRNWYYYSQKVQNAVTYLSALAAKIGVKVDFSGVDALIKNSMDKAFEFVKTNYKTIFSTLGDVGKGVTNFTIGVMFGFCFMVAKKDILKVFSKLRRAVSAEKKIERRDDVWKRCHKIFIRYMGSTLLDACIVAVSTLIFMLIAGMPYAPLIAVVVGVCNIIPTFGPMIGNVVGVFFLILESPLQALIFFVFTCILQTIDGMIIKPKLFKDSLGIPAVWTIVLIVLGGKIAGIAGIILAMPFAAIFVILYKESFEPRLEKRRLKINAEAAASQEQAEESVAEAEVPEENA